MPPLLLTMGDPTGIGPEIIIKALLDGELEPFSRPLQVLGDGAVLLQAAKLFAVEGELVRKPGSISLLRLAGKELALCELSRLDPQQLRYGRPDSACGRAMARYIEVAISRCLDGSAAGMVTCPINKAAINAAGYPFPGHTELLAERCQVSKVVMMLAGERLKVCLVTTHLPYREVAQRLSSEAILETMQIAARSLREQFGIAAPRLAVLALNPHAGEQGLFGDEEERLIAPAIARAKELGIAASGPHSADGLFPAAVRGDYDAVICMYHDQGLIPLKLLHFEDAVNVTLGLPIVRTSVDHGTAYDIAGSGRASISSLLAAIRMAEQMC